MSRMRFWLPAAAFGLGLCGFAGVQPAHAQLAGQAGAVDPSFYNTAGPGVVNEMRPTLVFPQHANPVAAANPGDGAKLAGWSPVNGPYSSYNGQALASNKIPGDTPATNVAGR